VVFGDDSSNVIPAKAGIQEVFISFNIRLKNNIDSPLLISGITENENNEEKERKHWIPNQVGDDSGVVFGDDSSNVIPAKAGIQEVFFVIPHLMRIQSILPSFNINERKNIESLVNIFIE